MNKEQEMTSDPSYHVNNVRSMLQDVIAHIEKDQGLMNDPKALALFETSREVLKGLVNSFDHFEKKTEKAWK